MATSEIGVQAGQSLSKRQIVYLFWNRVIGRGQRSPKPPPHLTQTCNLQFYRAQVRVAEGGSIEFYKVFERRKAENLDELRQFQTREDKITYEPILIEILSLFGQKGIKTSLERTMGKYLESTGGIYRNAIRKDWELEKVSKLLAHNNAAERPFAVVKAYLDCFPTMKLSTLANYSLATSNGSHQAAGTQGKTAKTKLRLPKPPGIAVSSPYALRTTVTKLCGVRRMLPGLITALLRTKYAKDCADENTRRKAYTQAELDKKARGHLKKGIKFNNVSTIPILPTHPRSKTYTPLLCCLRTWKSLWRIRMQTWKTS